MLKVMLMFLVMMFMLYFLMGWEIMFGVYMCVLVCMLGLMHMELLNYNILGYSLGGNMMNMGLFVLSCWIVALMIIASVNMIDYSGEGMKLLFLFSVVLLLFVFMSSDLMLFYLAFEGVLIPTYILIVGWGYQPERLQAGLYLMFYTLIASLPLLVIILGLNHMTSICGGMYISFKMGYHWLGVMMYFAGVMAFFIKMPLFMFHLWLPKAHVEAPISGSMLLAGVLLKMGGYGLYRMSSYFYLYVKSWGSLWVSIGLLGGVYLSLVCLRQNDIKSLIAYSSVVHMGLVVGGLMTLSWVGLMGSYILMVGHGLCSSGLFCLANMSYSKIHSRSLLLSKGLMSLMPSLALSWFLLSSSNMAAPPSLNLLGELTLIGSLLGWGYQVVWVLIVMSFLSASYCLYLFSFTQHGESVKLVGFYNVGMIEYLLIMLHWIPLNMLFLKGEMFYL